MIPKEMSADIKDRMASAQQCADCMAQVDIKGIQRAVDMARGGVIGVVMGLAIGAGLLALYLKAGGRISL